MPGLGENVLVRMITSPLLDAIPWVEHGFGTREGPASQEGMASLKQVHSSVALVTESGAGCEGEGDALITRRPAVTVSVRTADCLPILLADIHHRVVAAVHAGWRGTAAGVVTSTLEKMRAEFGTEAGDVVAAIGPGIGVCCYEVGEEVARQFGLERAGRVDLASENAAQLTRYGVAPERISVTGLCTFCNPAQFYSWRREHEGAGRMVSYIRVTKH